MAWNLRKKILYVSTHPQEGTVVELLYMFIYELHSTKAQRMSICYGIQWTLLLIKDFFMNCSIETVGNMDVVVIQICSIVHSPVLCVLPPCYYGPPMRLIRTDLLCSLGLWVGYHGTWGWLKPVATGWPSRWPVVITYSGSGVHAEAGL